MGQGTSRVSLEHINHSIEISEGLLSEQLAWANDCFANRRVRELKEEQQKLQERIDQISKMHADAPAKVQSLRDHIDKLKAARSRITAEPKIAELRQLRARLADLGVHVDVTG